MLVCLHNISAKFSRSFNHRYHKSMDASHLISNSQGEYGVAVCPDRFPDKSSIDATPKRQLLRSRKRGPKLGKKFPPPQLDAGAPPVLNETSVDQFVHHIIDRACNRYWNPASRLQIELSMHCRRRTCQARVLPRRSYPASRFQTCVS